MIDCRTEIYVVLSLQSNYISTVMQKRSEYAPA